MTWRRSKVRTLHYPPDSIGECTERSKVPGSDPVFRRFESCLPFQLFRPVAQLDKSATLRTLRSAVRIRPGLPQQLLL